MNTVRLINNYDLNDMSRGKSFYRRPADTETMEKVRQIIRSGILPNIQDSDVEGGISMDYAEGIIWLAGDDIPEPPEIGSKRRARLKKLMEKGFIEFMSDADLSKLSSHDADVMIEHGSSEHFRKRNKAVRPDGRKFPGKE